MFGVIGVRRFGAGASAVVAVLLLGVLLAAPSAATASVRADRAVTAAPADSAGLGPIHVDGQALRDDQGRQLLLRGIAVINKTAPYVPDVGPADFARIRRWGFDSIRLGILWAGIMPKPGVIDQHYLDAMATVVRQAGDAGLRVIVDMHQDVYGEPWGDGAPAWAGSAWPGNSLCPNLPLAKLTGAWALQNLSPDVNCAVTRFWLNPTLQAFYTQAWVAVASTMRDQPAVAGYDLINEPWQGLLPPPIFENGVLYPAQTRWLAAIHSVDPDAVGFVEPPTWKTTILVSTPPLSLPAQAVYSPHIYGPWDGNPSLAFTHPLADLNLDVSLLEDLVAQRPMWVGEWGTLASDPTGPAYAGHVMDLLDQHLLGGSYWAYSSGGGYSPFNADGSPRPLADAVAHGHPQAVAGALTSTSWDGSARRLVVKWQQSASDTPSVLAVPAPRYPDGVDVAGATNWDYDPSTGVVTVWASPGAATVTVTPHA